VQIEDIIGYLNCLRYGGCDLCPISPARCGECRGSANILKALEEAALLLEGIPDDGHYELGLYYKYIVKRVCDGSVMDNCFVLRPDHDEAARIAMRAYAHATPNKRLASDLLAWVGEDDSATPTTKEEPNL
jgi:hypothetical protein